MNGRVLQISVSPGGVPKLPVPVAEVGGSGIRHDGHNYSGHGGPEKALCLYSLERIVSLQAEGHPIYPGSTGENVTISGLDWGALSPGDTLCIGEEIVAQITSYTAPCGKIAGSFAGGDISRMDQQRHPGWARLYARVSTGGTLRPGDPVVVSRGE